MLIWTYPSIVSHISAIRILIDGKYTGCFFKKKRKIRADVALLQCGYVCFY
jgi:hypothetical protein